MTKNKLKSTLDLSFADVNLSQAKLLLLDAQNNADSTMAALDAVLGLDRQVTYDLVEDNTPSAAAAAGCRPAHSNSALQQRPDLQALNYQPASSGQVQPCAARSTVPDASARLERRAACPFGPPNTTSRTGGAALA